MIFTLNILINLCLVFAVWKVNRWKSEYLNDLLSYSIKTRIDLERWQEVFANRTEKRLHSRLSKMMGKREKQERRSAIAEKTADRAFSMASSASLGVIALQKALAVPRILSKPQVLANQLAKKGVDDIFSNDTTFDFMRPYLDDEENEQIDKIIEARTKGQET